MLGVGEKFPAFNLKAIVSTDLKNAFVEINNTTYKDKWLVVFFWPKDFTFVCPTEIFEFSKYTPEFAKYNAQLLGGSVDSEFVHLAWRESNPKIKDTPFPMLSDIKRELSAQLGIIDPIEGVTQRATFIVDPLGIIRFASVTDMKVGRNVREVLRVLEALQTDKLCPCGWNPGDDTL